MMTPLKRSHSDEGGGAKRSKLGGSDSSCSEDSGCSDESSSWAPSSSSSEDSEAEASANGGEVEVPRVEGAPPPVYCTRSRGGFVSLQPADEVNAAMDLADVVVNAESDLSSDTSSDSEEEDEDEDVGECEEEEEEEEESSEEDDEYSDDDSFVTSDEEEEDEASQCSNHYDSGGGDEEQSYQSLVLGADDSALGLESCDTEAPAQLIRCNGGIDELCAGSDEDALP